LSFIVYHRRANLKQIEQFGPLLQAIEKLLQQFQHYGHICIKNCKDSRDYNDSKARESRAILLKREKILYTDSYLLWKKYELLYFKWTSAFYVFIDKINSKVRFRNTKSRNLCD